MGNQKYIREVVYNDECHYCGVQIPSARRCQRFQKYCSKECSRDMWAWCKKEGLLEYYKGKPGRFARAAMEHKRY